MVVDISIDDKLKQVVAELFEADPTKFNADFLLSTRRMQGSLTRAKLDAAIRHRLGVKCRAVYSAKTYGDLKKAVLGVSSGSDESDSSALIVSAVTNTDATVLFSENKIGSETGLSCGIDVEMVENFPEVDDYWKDAFYTNSFLSVEIAYCLLQDNPRMHFAARWCAREALKKCQPSYLPEEMKNLECVASESGKFRVRHYVKGLPVVLPFAVSISATTHIAVAMVLEDQVVSVLGI